jgi:hypothetical protein
MHPEVHKYLDGEIERSALSAQAQAELREWESFDNAIAERRSAQAPPWLANDVMRALPAVHVPAWRRAWQWLMTPRPIHVPPLAPIAATALAVLALVTVFNRTPVTPALVQTAQGEVPVVYVQFALTAKGAQTVSVAGDFNDWSVDTGTLRDPDGDGVFSGLIAVKPGVHKYMFIVNGQEWVTDPLAASYVDDGFGMRNALLAVTPPPARS